MTLRKPACPPWLALVAGLLCALPTQADDIAAAKARVTELEKQIADRQAAAEPAWKQAQATNTLNGYRDYIRANPGSPFLNEAFAALFDKVKAANSVAVYSEALREFPDAPDYAKAREAQLKLAGIESRHSFRHGKIGERYVPSYSEARYSTQTYTINGKSYYERKQTGSDTYGGYSTDRMGYTAVYQVFNESKQYYVIKLRLSGSSRMSETYVKDSWAEGKGHATSTSTQKLTKEMSYLLDADGDVKDQEVVGESQPHDFALEIIDIIPVTVQWMEGLRQALDGKANLKQINTYMSDDKAAAWHDNLRRCFAEAAKKQVKISTSTGKRFDPDFDSPVTVTIVNNNPVPIKLDYKPNFGQGGTLELAPGKSELITVTARGVTQRNLNVSLENLLPVNVAGSVPEVSVPYAESINVRIEAQAPLRNLRDRLAFDRLVVEGKNIFTDCPKCPEMVVIPRGSFDMGSAKIYSAELPVHPVYVPQFAIGKTEVTKAQWRAIMGDSDKTEGGLDYPVSNVSWNDAQEFIRRINIKTGRQYRLPSEAEWEYSCLAGGKHRYCGSDDQNEVGWHYSNSDNPHPVSKKKPNAFGLYDMSGNVWEWVEDCWNGNYNGAPTDGRAWSSGDCGMRVMRGGSYYKHGPDLDARLRSRLPLGERYRSGGLRIARDY